MLCTVVQFVVFFTSYSITNVYEMCVSDCLIYKNMFLRKWCSDIRAYRDIGLGLELGLEPCELQLYIILFIYLTLISHNFNGCTKQV